MEFSSCDGGEGGKHTDIRFVEISKIFTMLDTILFGMSLFGRGYKVFYQTMRDIVKEFFMLPR